MERLRQAGLRAALKPKWAALEAFVCLLVQPTTRGFYLLGYKNSNKNGKHQFQVCFLFSWRQMIFWSIYLSSLEISGQLWHYLHYRFSTVSKNLLKTHIQREVFLLFIFIFLIFNLFTHFKNDLLTDSAWSFQLENTDQHLGLQSGTDKIPTCNTSFSRVLTPGERRGALQWTKLLSVQQVKISLQDFSPCVWQWWEGDQPSSNPFV